MYDNDDGFEKRVQETLQDLSFAPSEPVWKGIDAQLSPRRRSGGIIWWSSLLGAAAMIGGYLFFFPNTEADEIKSTLLVTAPEKSSVPDNKAGMADKAGVKTWEEATAGASSAPAAPASPVTPATPASSTGPAIAPAGQAEAAAPASGPALVKSPLSEQKATLAKTGEATGKQVADLAQRQQPENGLKGLQPSTPLLAENRLAKNQPVFAGVTGKPAGKELAGVSIKAPAPAYNRGYLIAPPRKSFLVENAIGPEVSVAARKRWNIEISANTGQSIFNSGEVNKLFTAAQLSVLNSRQPPPGMSLTAAIIKPAEVQPGWSIAFGADARYHLARHVSITGGLYYNLLTTRMQTGRKMHQGIRVQQNNEVKELDTYYSSGSGNNYTNDYHFIEIPLLLYVQLNEGKKLPLFVNGGLSYAHLISTNALHYDGALNIYYDDPSLVKKDFINVEGGFSARFFANKRVALLAGPEIQYGLTNLLKGKADNGDKHSLFVGLKMGLSF